MTVEDWNSPYPTLPGHLLGPHDSLEFVGDLEVVEREGLSILDGMTWWHHADRPPAGRRQKGARCGGGNLSAHTLMKGTIEDLGSVTIHPSLSCRMCGRHVFIRDGAVQDLGDAHDESS